MITVVAHDLANHLLTNGVARAGTKHHRRTRHSHNPAAHTASRHTHRHRAAPASGKFKSPLGHKIKPLTRPLASSSLPQAMNLQVTTWGLSSLSDTRTSHNALAWATAGRRWAGLALLQ